MDPKEERSLLKIYTSDDSMLLQEALCNKRNNNCCSMYIYLYLYVFLCENNNNNMFVLLIL